jgi:site-specific DNA-methyltransferase (adenine-specific)
MKITDIKVSDNRRTVDPDKVKSLAKSIETIGLLNPIVVNLDGTLIAGAHRIEAFKLLGRDEIPASIIDANKLIAELAEIHENLIRNDLHWTEKDPLLARSKQIHLELYPETAHGAKGGKGNNKKLANENEIISFSFTGDTANKIGQSKRNVELSVQRGENILPGIMPKLKELDISKTDGTALARIDPEQQVRVIELVESKRIPVSEAVREVKKDEKRSNFIDKKNTFEAQSSKTGMAYCYHGNCLDYLNSDMPKIDLLLSDPPYAIDYKSGWNDWDRIDNDKRSDTLELLDKSFSLAKNKLADDAHIYIFGSPYEIESVKPIFEKYFKLKNILIWDRGVIGMGDLKTFGRSYDVIYFGYNKTWKELSGVRDRDILQYGRVSPGELMHPTEKPIPLLEYLIKKSTNEGDNILDPFAGSCSTLMAATNLGRNSFGSELQSKYIPLWISKRI